MTFGQSRNSTGLAMLFASIVMMKRHGIVPPQVSKFDSSHLDSASSSRIAARSSMRRRSAIRPMTHVTAGGVAVRVHYSANPMAGAAVEAVDAEWRRLGAFRAIGEGSGSTASAHGKLILPQLGDTTGSAE
jgi:hypothetical protein